MITSGGTDAELAARKAARKRLLSGVATGVINEAYETVSRRDNQTMVLKIGVTDANGLQRTFIDYLTDTDQAGLRLRHACAAVGVLAEFEAGHITPEMFAGRGVRIKLKVEKGKNGYPPRSVVDDYLPIEASPVVNLRAAR